MDAAGDGEAVLRLAVEDGVATRNDGTGLSDLIGRTLEDPLQLCERRILRPRRDVQREQHLATHRVDVRHRVRRAYRARGVRVVDDGREEVEGLDDRRMGRDEIHGRVIGHIQADEQLRGSLLIAHRTQYLRQRARAQLGSSAGAGGERRQPDLIAREHRRRWYSGKRKWRADRRVPDRCRERDEEQRECEIRCGPSAPNDHENEEESRSRDQDEVEDEEQQCRAHITLCSRTSWPDLNRDALSALMSSEVLPSTMSSAMSSPVAGACMMPCPENPAALMKPSILSPFPNIGCLSGVSSYRPAHPVFIDVRSRIGKRASARSTTAGMKSGFTLSSKPGFSFGSAIPRSTPPDSRCP